MIKGESGVGSRESGGSRLPAVGCRLAQGLQYPDPQESGLGWKLEARSWELMADNSCFRLLGIGVHTEQTLRALRQRTRFTLPQTLFNLYQNALIHRGRFRAADYVAVLQ